MSAMTILLVEDNPGDARLLEEALRELEPLRFTLTHVTSVADALHTLLTNRFDIGILDLGLPDARGVEVVQRIHEAVPAMPIIVLSALADDVAPIESLHHGAQDYLVKADLDRHLLWRAMRYAICRQRVKSDLQNRSLLDDLTGLNNRKGFFNLANHHMALAARTRKPFLVGFVDLDYLKQINDTYGHQEGNRALVETATTLKDCFRQSDILSRFGGDEFAVLIVNAAANSIPIVTERLEQKVAFANGRDDRPYRLSLSIGIVAGTPASGVDLEQLLHQADALMYAHKQKKRALRQPVQS